MSKRKRDERDGPTPETLAKLVPDQIDAMVRNKLIGRREEDAARELDALWYALQRGIFGGFDGDGGGSGLRGIESLTPGEMWKWRHWFKPWSENVGRAAGPTYRVVFCNEEVGKIERGVVVVSLRRFAGLMDKQPYDWREVEKMRLTA